MRMGLINQLKEAVPAMQKSISDLTDEVSSISSSTPMIDYSNRFASPIQAQSSGRTFEYAADEITNLSSKLSSIQLDKASTSPSMKLPHLFSLTPNMSGKSVHTPKRTSLASHTNKSGNISETKSIDLADNALQGGDHYIRNLRRSVREAALAAKPSSNEVLLSKKSPVKKSYDDTHYFFMPLSQEDDVEDKHIDEMATTSLLSESEELNDCNGAKSGHILNMGFENLGQTTSFDFDEALNTALSPTLMMDDSSLFTDLYEDLLGPLSETDAALMEQ